MGLDACGDEYWEQRDRHIQQMDIGALLSDLLEKPLQENGTLLEKLFLKLEKYEQETGTELFKKDREPLLPFLKTHLKGKFEELLDELIPMKVWNEDFRKRYNVWEEILHSAGLVTKDIGITEGEINVVSVRYRMLYGSIRLQALQDFIDTNGASIEGDILGLQPEELHELCFSRTPEISPADFGLEEGRFEALAMEYYKILEKWIESAYAQDTTVEMASEALYILSRLEDSKRDLQYAVHFSIDKIPQWQEALHKKKKALKLISDMNSGEGNMNNTIQEIKSGKFSPNDLGLSSPEQLKDITEEYQERKKTIVVRQANELMAKIREGNLSSIKAVISFLEKEGFQLGDIGLTDAEFRMLVINNQRTEAHSLSQKVASAQDRLKNAEQELKEFMINMMTFGVALEDLISTAH